MSEAGEGPLLKHMAIPLTSLAVKEQHMQPTATVVLKAAAFEASGM